ncbi:hypothetical protein [Sunxiuqinia indica]|uniref:hypothetical protein n=1 Tax=Sunxiuqinia indica TaxID=2692584 RepID=UPI0013569D5D|nr:hypothetical protein [Sunxiuqinia indica]
MRKLLFISLTLLISLSASSQQYDQAVGIRGGYSSGFEYRAFTNEYVSYKALLSTRKNGIQLTGLKEFHQYGLFDFSNDVVFIYGFGAHVGYEKWNAYDPDDVLYRPYYYEKKTGPVAGLDGLVAVEYTLMDIPLTFGIEAKPFFNLFGKNFFQLHPFDFAFTIKYIF